MKEPVMMNAIAAAVREPDVHVSPLFVVSIAAFAVGLIAFFKLSKSRVWAWAALLFSVAAVSVAGLFVPHSMRQKTSTTVTLHDSSQSSEDVAVLRSETTDLETLSVADSAATSPSTAERSDSDETVWLPVSRETLAGIFGSENVENIETLSAQLSEQSEKAYALIPVSEAEPTPVIRHVLTPTPFRELLTPQNMQLLATALEAYAEKPEDSASAEIAGDVTGISLASWVNEKPGLDQAVVQTDQFHESTVPAEKALRPAITAALEDHITSLCQREFSIGDDWRKLVDVKMSDQAVRECIVRTDRKVSEFDTIEGRKTMQQTYALIQFPDAVETDVLATIRRQLVMSRTGAIVMTLGTLWVAALLLAVACRVGHRDGSRLQRWVTGPLIAIAAIPCLLGCLVFLAAMAEGHTFDVGLSGHRIACMIDSSK